MVGINSLLLLSVAMTLGAALGRRYLPGVPYPTLMVFPAYSQVLGAETGHVVEPAALVAPMIRAPP